MSLIEWCQLAFVLLTYMLVFLTGLDIGIKLGVVYEKNKRECNLVEEVTD